MSTLCDFRLGLQAKMRAICLGVDIDARPSNVAPVLVLRSYGARGVAWNFPVVLDAINRQLKKKCQSPTLVPYFAYRTIEPIRGATRPQPLLGTLQRYSQDLSQNCGHNSVKL
jgi:hypothetical protein